MQVETNGSDKALARIALTNAAAMLDNAAADPALDANTPRRRTRASDRLSQHDGRWAAVAPTLEYRAALDEVNAKDAAMKKVCGGG